MLLCFSPSSCIEQHVVKPTKYKLNYTCIIIYANMYTIFLKFTIQLILIKIEYKKEKIWDIKK